MHFAYPWALPFQAWLECSVVRSNRSSASPIRLARLATIGCGVLWLAGAPAYGLITVNQPWAKPGVRTSDAYMILTSTEDATLIGASSSLAARVDLMGQATRPLSGLPLRAGKPVTFRPGANRFRLSDLSRPLRLGDRVPLLLIIETAAGVRSEIAVDAEVRNESPVDAELRAHRH
jgi:periplasmic copper chaperone A